MFIRQSFKFTEALLFEYVFHISHTNKYETDVFNLPILPNQMIEMIFFLFKNNICFIVLGFLDILFL